MSTRAIDYDALAKQYGATSSNVDYDALAKQYGATSAPSGAPPPAAGPHVDMQEEYLLTGKNDPSNLTERIGSRIESNIAGPIRQVLNATNPRYVPTEEDKARAKQTRENVLPSGMNPAVAAATIGPRTIYQMGKGLAEDYSRDPANLAGDVVTGIIAGAAGEAETPGIPANREVVPGKSWIRRQDLGPASEQIAKTPVEGLVTDAIAKLALKKIPGYHLVKDAVQFAKDLGWNAEDAAAKTAPAPVTVPQTEGTPWGKPILNQPQPTPAEPVYPRAMERGPQPVHGESALGDILTRQDNGTLLKIAKSRGINVTRESQLKPGVGDPMLIRKIIDDFSPDELQEMGAKYMEATRFQHQFGSITPEAWHTLSLGYYFPDVKIAGAVLKRSHASVAGASTDLTPILKKSLAAARRK